MVLQNFYDLRLEYNILIFNFFKIQTQKETLFVTKNKLHFLIKTNIKVKYENMIKNVR